METIGFLGERPFAAGGQGAAYEPPLEIWGTDRSATCFSLFDNLRLRSSFKSNHVFEGHEDWSVGWLAKGNVWVTSDEVCSRVQVRIDDLHRWALYRQSDNVEFDDDLQKAVVDLRHQQLGTTSIGGADVSLVRGFRSGLDPPGHDSDRRFTVSDVVYWEVEGPINLRTIVEEWVSHFESFVRFMTMEPSVVSGIDCRLVETGGTRLHVELVVPRLPRGDQGKSSGSGGMSPHKYLTTLRTLQDQGIDPMDLLDGYWKAVVTGGSYMSMALHLESQDRLVSRGTDGALLNSIRSVESLHAAQNEEIAAERVSVQAKIDDSMRRAGDVGAEIVDAWPQLRRTGKLRHDMAHGRARPGASFGLRCLGGAMALQWIQRARLLAEFGMSDSLAQAIVADYPQLPKDVETLRNWSAELGG